MIDRKSRIRIIQMILLISCGAIIFFTYFKKYDVSDEKIISIVDQKKIKKENVDSSDGDVFYNIKYSGLDLSGNRYVLTSKEAKIDKNSQEIVNMKYVSGVFYFKDNTTLFVESDKGIYNNRTFDMIFEKNVKANYEGSELFGETITYLNSKRVLEVSENVIVNDVRGSITAEKLLFDLEKKTLDISSSKNKVKANINLK